MIHMSSLMQNFANVIVFILIANRVSPYILSRKNPGKEILIGILFGLAGLISMLLSVHHSGPMAENHGVTIDLKAVISGMSGVIGGPVSALAAFILMGSFRIAVGGMGMIPGLLVMAICAATGAWLHVRYRNRDISFRKIWWGPVLFGLFVSAAQLASLWMFAPDVRTALFREFTIPLVIVFPLTALLFHYFMSVEWIRHHDSLFDRVTQLPRWELASGKFNRWINRRQSFSLVILNAERLRSVVDMHGLAACNSVLLESAERIQAYLPAGGTLSRMAGQEFAVLLPDFNILQSLIWIVEVKKKLADPYTADNQTVRMTFSTGLAVYEGTSTTLDELLLQAQTALRHAMDSGTNQTVPYESRLTEQLRYRTSLEKDLGFALERRQLELHYQPQYELASGKLRGFEALLRWQHPDWGTISPEEFIPLAEETRLIIPIGRWVLETACDMAAKLNESFPRATIAVNVSAVQLLERDFPDQVAAVLASSGLQSERLEIELTESTMVRSFEQAAEQLLLLKKLGVRLALDDFGVGYSSLSYLRRLPFDLIKIDRSFIEDIGRSRDDRMTKSIIDWVRELRYGIVAEGLESYDQLYWLRQWKCDIAQGYLFSRPMPEEDLFRYLSRIGPVSMTDLVRGTDGIPS
jgi:diguanylate cyclase (GGDEF)-like protein